MKFGFGGLGIQILLTVEKNSHSFHFVNWLVYKIGGREGAFPGQNIFYFFFTWRKFKLNLREIRASHFYGINRAKMLAFIMF